ncbi:ABC transporter permease [Bosea sp. SSUT16]|jgi:branched-chain amino acid transport system permease protein|uniref:ABC transporter permease n=1 Tax=Bosea spartocytisi TaxID=2773451 RepID=A0A927E6Z3_9HYPH|nr:ABC transporter permease [Bosea spartocytisi]MBD3844096.1 ABC transporter permease [Bosea spartocytisi]MCT4470796.1 ABC transporter permease [Bosea spartocytisi]
MTSWFDHTINGLIIGNIYGLLAVGLALIFGVSRLINFAHGSVYVVGAYVGWVAVSVLQTPFPLTLAIVVIVTAALGVVIERFGIRPLAGAPRIAPLLATIGLSFVLDQTVQILFSPDPRAVPMQVPNWRIAIGGGSIGVLDLLIAGIGISAAAALFGFLKLSKWGWAVRATALDRDAARAMGVDVDRVNSIVFAIASALGGVGGVLVGMYYNVITPTMGFEATLKGIVAEVVGGVGNVPGAIVGSLLLGLVESYGVALLGTSYRNLFAFVLLIAILVIRPNGLFASRRQLPPEPMTGTFVAPSKPVRLPPLLIAALAALAIALPLIVDNGYLIQTLTNAWLYALLGLSITLVAGTSGQVSLGHAALLAIGGYTSALLASNLGWPVWLTLLIGGFAAAGIGTLLVSPAFRLRGHYVSIATLGIGEIVALVILNWESVTRGPIGVAGIPPLSLFGRDLYDTNAIYWFAFALMAGLALLQLRLLRSHLGRTFRAVRDDDVAARSFGIGLERYKGLAFAFGGFFAGISGAFTAHMYSYINHETFNTQISVLALTIAILGGMGNVGGAILGSLALIGLPEIFRVAAEYRILFYGIALLLLVRFRPQGLLGTV